MYVRYRPAQTSLSVRKVYSLNIKCKTQINSYYLESEARALGFGIVLITIQAKQKTRACLQFSLYISYYIAYKYYFIFIRYDVCLSGGKLEN